MTVDSTLGPTPMENLAPPLGAERQHRGEWGRLQEDREPTPGIVLTGSTPGP